MDIFVGNLSFGASEGDVKNLFGGFGNVVSVVIVMRKEKKTPKSRGFGFVQMPDKQQALAAIAALNGREFMGRVIDVNLARPKAEEQILNKRIALKDGRAHPLRQPGTYRGGRRARSYMKRRELSGMQEEAKPRKRSQDNPMRWRKRKDQAKPRKKAAGDANPWSKSSGRPTGAKR